MENPLWWQSDAPKLTQVRSTKSHASSDERSERRSVHCRERFPCHVRSETTMQTFD